MKKKSYWKDLVQSFTRSKGRFFSILSLMGIGALALIGLKVTTPNMRRTAQAFIDKTNLMDLAVMADYGLDKTDVEELSALPKATVEFAYLTDVTITNSQDAVRVFSRTASVSQFQLSSGRLPQLEDEIALADKMSSQYQLGDTISFTQSEQAVLKQSSFKLVGFVNSAEIWDNDAMGQTRAGAGELTGYAVVPETSFDSDVYMIARISYDDLDKLSYYQDSYEEKLSKHREALDSLLADNGKRRLATLQASAQADINAGYDDLSASEQKLTDAAQAISDGKKELSDGQATIDVAKEAISANQAKLDGVAKDLATAWLELTANADKLAQTKLELDQAKAGLDASKEQLDKAEADLFAAKADLEASKLQLDTMAESIASSEQEMASAQADIYAKTDALIAAGQDPLSSEEITRAQTELAKKEVQLGATKQAYQAGLSQYETGLAGYESHLANYQAGLSQYQAGLAEYNTGKESYESGLAAYQVGLAKYEAYQADYQSGLAELEKAKATITSNQASLDKAKAELEKSEADYHSQKTEADENIAAAKVELNTAKTDLANLKEPDYISYTRKTLPASDGYATYSMGAEAISAVGDIFPVVLYLVAAMVTLTTMTRFVDEERHKAGIFKALGYTNDQIIAKFLIYGLVASLAGTLIGTLLGHYFLSPIIGNILTDGTVIGSSRTYFYPSWTALAVGLALLSALLPTYLVARHELSANAAQLFQAKPPVAGSKILLEKISFIWRRLSFTHKVTARNIFRYKQRMLMTIFGVAGSVALLFAGLGIQSSISGVADTQFGDIVHYDMIVAIRSQKDKPTLERALAANDIKKSQSIYYQALTEKIKGIDDELAISLIVADSSAISDYISLRERDSGEALSLGQSGAIITEKLATLYGISKGDSLKLTLADHTETVVVSGITEMYVGQYIYMTADYYQAITGQDYQTNSYLVELTDQSTETIQDQAAAFLAMDEVIAVAQNTALEKTLHTVADSLQSVMIILIILSVLLGVVILYNLTNINVAERIRELSTIKVLGFHNKEVTLYIYRETITLSIIGIVTGLIGGRLLHHLILGMIGSNQIMFQPKVAFYVYLAPIIAIISILAILGYFVNYKLRHLDMLEALKSVE